MDGRLQSVMRRILHILLMVDQGGNDSGLPNPSRYSVPWVGRVRFMQIART